MLLHVRLSIEVSPDYTHRVSTESGSARHFNGGGERTLPERTYGEAADLGRSIWLMETTQTRATSEKV